MPGFFISNTNRKIKLKNYDNSRCCYEEMDSNGWIIQRNTLNKFMDDKIFFQNEEFIIILDGVILNKLDLMKAYNSEQWVDTILEMLREDKFFFSRLRGAFSGAIYEKRKDSWMAFTDQISNHLLLFYSDGTHVAVGSELAYFSTWMKENKIDRNICKDWENDFFSFGYMLDTHTIINGVKRVFPGSYICCSQMNQWKIEEEQYYMINAQKINMDISVDDAIEQIDMTFHNAVNRILDKNREYGYKTVIDISGGLDSRMNACIANQNETREKLLCINYAQDGSSDQTISKQLVKELNLESIFYLMDGGDCITSIDDFVLMNQGMNYFLAITGGKNVLELLDRGTYGIELIGVLGDVYEGAMIDEEGTDAPNWLYNRFRTSRRFPIFNEEGYERRYDNNEILWFYIRGIFMGMNTAFIRQNYMEALTPYGDVDFMNLHFSLPYRMRVEQHIYRKWMMKKYPKMARIKYSGTGVPVTDNDRKEFLCTFPRRALRKVRKILFGAKKEWSMNPIDFWYKENVELKQAFDDYFNLNIESLKNDETILMKVNELYKEGNTMEKAMALTILSAIKQYIIS